MTAARMFQPIRLYLPLLLALSLAACGGGGGTTGPLIVRDGAPIKVAVVDTGFVVTHSEYADHIHSYKVFPTSTATNETTIQDTEDPHGTYVAQVIAGNVQQEGDVTLVLAKATPYDNDPRPGFTNYVLSTTDIKDATVWALSEGARVVNYSLAPMYLLDSQLTTAYDTAVTKDAVLVMAAGNDSLSISADIVGKTNLFQNTGYTSISLLVGAVEESGGVYSLASYSNYAGSNTTVQSRFLVAEAPVEVAEGWVSGTSFTAPQVSAALGSLLAQWPHLTAAQSSGILLDTADKTVFSVYDPVLYGQGLLDLDAALQPVGSTSLVTGSSVSDSGYSVSGSGLTLPAAFGDAALGLALDAAMFDSYGRDFGFNLGSLLQSATNTASSRHWMGLLGSRTHEHEDDQFHLRTAFGPDGSLQASRVGLAFGDGHRLHWQRAQGRAYEQDALPVPLLTLAGHGTLGSYGWLDRMGLDWRLDDRRQLHASLTRAHHSPDTTQDDQTAWRHEAGLSVRAGPATTVTAGIAVTTESRALLGSGGSGALALNRSLAQAATLRLRHDLGEGWTAFGSAELGTVQVQGDTLLAGMDSVVTSEWTAGLAWTGGDRLLGLAVSQPVRVERASAHFDLPVGRTLDGTVLRQSRTVHLAPSGRQINLELAWQQGLGGHSARRGTLGLHAVYARDAGHVRGASDWALLGSYRRIW
jgi:hypothetical protein